MLARLTIRDIVLIDRLEIGFEPGLSTLTGETGAGKSILLDALALALGARGDAALVRKGCEEGQVTAVFVLPRVHACLRLLEENGLAADDDELILRRVQAADGRTRAFVNDQPVSQRLLREIGAGVIEIHGQHADRALLDPASHRVLLDAFGGLGPRAAEVAGLWRQLSDGKAAVAAQRASLAAIREEAEYLTAAVEELEALDAEPGEEERLAEERQRMLAAERVAGDLNEAVEMIGGRASPVPQLAALLRKLERKSGHGDTLLTPALDALGRALDALEEARATFEDALNSTDYHPLDLERSEERLFALRAAARKFQVPVDGLPGLAAEMAGRLAALESGEERLARLKAERDAAGRAFQAAAEELSAQRRQAARELETAVAVELVPLKLERARFFAVFEPGQEPGPNGIDSVVFHVQTNPGTSPGPMMRVASGGELSRFLLALKVSLAGRGSAPTLIFDEIDAGVGGAVAEAIGVRLARLAASVQVIAVTHAPQVAARADHHFLISKAPTAAGTVATAVVTIEDDSRREEIARMLAGAVITDEARAAAKRLIDAH
jgi:DNA repair protein RecN (Recombination protein N)